jgi:hypothetical protein
MSENRGSTANKVTDLCVKTDSGDQQPPFLSPGVKRPGPEADASDTYVPRMPSRPAQGQLYL